MKKLVLISFSILLAGCASQYKIPSDAVPSATLTFELLTSSGTGGGALLIGSDEECKANNVVSAIRLGHSFQSDKNIVETKVLSGKPITLFVRVVDAFYYGCEPAVVFTPEAGKEYYSTFEYHIPGCRIKVYEGSPSANSEIEVKTCN